MTLLLTYLGTALTGSDHYGCKTCSPIDKMGEESWDSWDPGGGLANQAPGFATFQVFHGKANSIILKPGLQFGPRLMNVSVWVCPGIISRNQDSLWSLTHRAERRYCLGPFPSWDSRCPWHGTSQRCLSLEVGQNPICWCILCSINVSILKIS